MHRQLRVFSRTVQANQLNHLRSASQTTADQHGDKHSKELANARPMSEIPGPTMFQLIRGFLPGGIYYKKSFDDFALISRDIYGDIYQIPDMFGRKGIVSCFNADDFPTLLRCDGAWPKRRGLDSVNYHRKVHRKDDFGDVVGLLSSNDEQWGKLRSAVNPILMQPRNARLYINKMLEVNDEFLQRIREIRDPDTLEMPDTFEDEINRLTFESVAVIALNRQIGLIRKDRNNEEAKKLFTSLRAIFELVPELDISPSMWRIVKTPKFHKLMEGLDALYDIMMKYVNQAVERIENDTSPTNENEEKSVLEKLLKIDKHTAQIMAMDMLMAGVDTTSSTLAGIFLCIAKNPEKQEKLREEIRAILPKKDSLLTIDNMKNLPYLRACIKEGMRIYPIGAGVMRSNEEDIVLSGYRIPKHRDIVVNANLLLKDEKHYSKPNEFIPERWLRNDNKDHPTMNPFLFIPFGFGARSCVGRRIVEMEMEITVARLVRNFNMEFNYPTEKAFKSLLINVPAIPLKFKFSEIAD